MVADERQSDHEPSAILLAHGNFDEAVVVARQRAACDDAAGAERLEEKGLSRQAREGENPGDLSRGDGFALDPNDTGQLDRHLLSGDQEVLVHPPHAAEVVARLVVDPPRPGGQRWKLEPRLPFRVVDERPCARSGPSGQPCNTAAAASVRSHRGRSRSPGVVITSSNCGYAGSSDGRSVFAGSAMATSRHVPVPARGAPSGSVRATVRAPGTPSRKNPESIRTDATIAVRHRRNERSPDRVSPPSSVTSKKARKE